MNNSSKINSYLMTAICAVSHQSVGSVVPGDSNKADYDLKRTSLKQGVIYLFHNLKDFFEKMLAIKLQLKGTQ